MMQREAIKQILTLLPGRVTSFEGSE